MIGLKEKLNNGELAVGSWITLAHPAIAEIMAKAGFDWLTVDLEHSVITIREAEELIRVIDLCGVVPLVRLSANDPVQIKRVMDAGAHGVIVPMVNSRADAISSVASVYYPPKGHRGVGLARAQGYGTAFEQYREHLNTRTVIIAQVEHIDAVNNLSDILSVPGINGYLIGPYDLSASMNLPGQFGHPDMKAAIAKIRRIGSELDKPGGLHIVEPDLIQLEEHIREGFKFIAYSLDTRMLDTACRSGMMHARKTR
jgi:2-keto-3-deoxy-L-rhamnonate aldolase RhmA